MRSLLLLLVPILSGCSSILFQPSPYLYYDPAKLNLRFDEVHFPSLDGTSLYGWYFHHQGPNVTPKGVIFFAHGNAQNISSHFTSLVWTLDHGYDFFIFDYRGYGTSKGDVPTAKEGVTDTIAALRWTDAKAKKTGVPLLAFGQSLGSALLVRALVEEKKTIHPVLIGLDSSFLSFQWAGASVLSQYWITTPFQPLAFLFLSDEWAPRLRIQELAPTPIVVIHGDQDRVIDFKLGKETYDAALPPKTFIRAPGAGHIQSFWGPEGQNIQKLFLEKMDQSVKSP